ncbi:hypothetical protein RFI_05742 [Reticulomyxa filosa]|uniref:Protein kinase domain-containing protein n=1 Tax=Reticulomyxa filosa TaxID=46433 RepID=X6NZL3_RETFI|nr:hypothetical protein RFI_05742 [Reticulomyxa filosa]|eukprot:ETO31376.1 hypothetical protein RFI_05742 [Reticulomyxa filosa]
MADNLFAPFPDYHILDITRQLCDAVACLFLFCLHFFLKTTYTYKHAFILFSNFFLKTDVHSLGIIIADLKPENVVIVDDRTVPQTSKNVSNNFFFLIRKTKNTYNKMIAFFKNEKQGTVVNVLLSTQIKIIDFGSAVVGTKGYYNHLVQTRHYRAPEVMLRIGWSFPVDMWSIGCTIVELVYGKILFNTHDTVDHLNQITNCVGKIPCALLKQLSPALCNDYFDSDGSIIMAKAKPSSIQCTSLDSYFTLKQLLFYKLAAQMLLWNPLERVSALSCSEALRQLCDRGTRENQTNCNNTNSTDNSSCSNGNCLQSSVLSKKPDIVDKTNEEKQHLDHYIGENNQNKTDNKNMTNEHGLFIMLNSQR